MKRRLLSLFVAFAMTVSMVVVGTVAVEPTYGDTAGHWAESAIERWSGHGIIQGSNGQFDPNGPLTCAQLATILAKLLKLPAATDAGFHDNAAGAWYYDAINRCAAAGILNGNGDGTVDPNGAISRERAMVMLGRALGIKPLENPDLTKFSDAAKVASYAQGMVAALIEKGVVGGVTSDTLAPQDDINRASTVTILDRAIGAYADKTGGVIKVEGTGIVIVVADDVTITGDVEQVIVPADNVDVTIRGCENIDSITVTGENSKVILENSSANDVTLDSKNTEIETKGNSKVDTVNVSEDAAGVTVNAGSGTTVKNVENSAADTTITGSGSVKNVASDTDVTVETKGTEVKNTGDEKISVTDKNGKTTETSAGGSSTTTGGSSSSSGVSSHSHSFATDTWTFDDTYHWHAATCGHDAVSEKAAHTEVIDDAVAATCTETGLTEGKHCSVCNKVLIAQTVTDALGHSFNGGDTCTVCGFTKCVEVWTGFSGTKVASYETIEEAAANLENLGEYKWIVVGSDYTLTENFTIPEGVFLDVADGATLTVAENVTLTVAANCKRLGVRSGATVVNNGTILVCGTDYDNGKVMVQNGGDLDASKLSVPDGRYLATNGSTNYYAALAHFTITYANGSTKQVDKPSADDLSGAARVELLHDLNDFALTISSGSNFVLDLGGHTLTGSTTASNPVLTISVPMTIQNGTICYASSNVGKEGNAALRTGADVTLASDLTVNGGLGYGVYTDGYGHTLTVNGKVTSNGDYAITGNGSIRGGDIDDCSIVINNGAEVSAQNGIAVYHPELGTVTVNGGTISGHTGVQMCAGKLVVNGGSITASGANTDYTGRQNAMKDGAAISIVNRNYPGGIPEAEITGGAFTTTGGGLTVKAYDYTNNAVATWTDAKTHVNITGGTFSSIPANMGDLCATGYIPRAVAGGFEVAQGSYAAAVTHDETSPAVETKYATLDEALAALHDGDTLTLLTDLTETLTVTVPCSVNLNGHSIAAVDGPAVNAALTGGWDALENKSVWILDMSDGPYGTLTSATGSAVEADSASLCEISVDASMTSAAGFADVALKNGAFGTTYEPSTIGEAAEVMAGDESFARYFGENGTPFAVKAAMEFSADTVTLLSDVSASEKLTIPKGASLVLDLNGKTYTTDSKTGIEISKGGELTAKGGRIVSEAASNYSYAVKNGGTLTIEDGTTITVSNGSCTCISNNGTLNIKGGELDARNGKYWLNVATTGKTTYIEGGTFLGNAYIKNGQTVFCITGGSFSTDALSGYCAEGHGMAYDEGSGRYVCSSAAATPGYTVGGDGNVTISAASGLTYFAAQVNNGNPYEGRTVTLTDNITLTDWTPAGSYSDGGSTVFKGTFNGGGHTVSWTNAADGGFFGATAGATIKGLTVKGTITPNRTKYIGGIVGHGSAVIESCTFEGTINGSGTAQVGGIAGSGVFTVKDCTVNGDITGSTWVGGITGNVQSGSGAYTNCRVTGTVKATLGTGNSGISAGGIAAAVSDAAQVISGCYADAYVVVNDTAVNCPVIGGYNSDTITEETTLHIDGNGWSLDKNSNTEYPVLVNGRDIGKRIARAEL